jgi:hypothetical protein
MVTSSGLRSGHWIVFRDENSAIAYKPVLIFFGDLA